MTEPVLVTGGTGVVGAAVLRRLVADGRAVRALARSKGSGDAVAALGAEAVRGDALDLASLIEAMHGCSTVFHVAGVNAMCLRDPSDMLRTNVEGSSNVIRAAADAGVGREDSPHRGSYLSAYERSKHLAERRVFELARTLGVDVVSVNPSSVQGPGRATGSARLLLEVVNGRLPVLVDTTISLIDIEDCAKGHVLAETHGTPGERYLLSGASLTTREAVVLLERIWGLPRRVRFAPGWVAMAGGELAGVVARVLRRDATLCPEAVRTLLHGHRYDGSKAARELGLRYATVETTLRRTLEWCEERGLVPPARERRTRT